MGFTNENFYLHLLSSDYCHKGITRYMIYILQMIFIKFKIALRKCFTVNILYTMKSKYYQVIIIHDNFENLFYIKDQENEKNNFWTQHPLHIHYGDSVHYSVEGQLARNRSVFSKAADGSAGLLIVPKQLRLYMSRMFCRIDKLCYT